MTDTPSTPPSRQRLGEILVQHQFITQEQLEEALRLQGENGAFIGQVLVELGAMAETDLSGFLSKYCKVPYMSLLDYLVDETMLQYIPKRICLQYRVLPIDKLGSNLTVAMVDPLDPEAIEAVSRHCEGMRIKPILCDYSHFEQVAGGLFGTKKKSSSDTMSASSLGLGPEADKAPESKPTPDATPDPAPDSAQGAASKSGPDSTPRSAAPALTPGTPAAPKSNPLMEDMMSFARDSMRDTYAVFAHRIPLFHGLDPEEIAAVFASGSTREISEGAVIFEQGSDGADLFVILAGSVTIQISGKEVEALPAGSMFGEMALVSGERRSATAVAAETSTLFVLNEATFQHLLTKQAAVRLLLNILGTMSTRIRGLNEKLGEK